MDHVLRTIGGIQVGVNRGMKSANDFIVKYRMPGQRERTPKHIHLVIDILLKKQGNPALTQQFVQYLLDILPKLAPLTGFPPTGPAIPAADVNRFVGLESYGEYKIEFLIYIFYLIMLQEKTNYPNGVMNRVLFEKILSGGDIFAIVSAATFR